MNYENKSMINNKNLPKLDTLDQSLKFKTSINFENIVANAYGYAFPRIRKFEPEKPDTKHEVN